MSQIAVEALKKQFGTQNAVSDVSFTVDAGECVVLLGPSGCGKSTTLRLIAGLEPTTSGRIQIAGRDVTGLSASGREISMVFQSYALFPHLDVARNITFGLEVRGVARAERDQRLAKVAELVGLTPYLQRKPSQLSGGQRQRVALARAIISERSVCLMDEPLSNLDAKLRHDMRVEIRDLQQRLGMTMIYVTHDQVEAMTMADRIILMKNGSIEQIGMPHELYDRPASTFVAGFMGLPPMNVIAGDDGADLIGVRAEHITIREANSAPRAGVVTHVEYLGADTMVSVDCPGGVVVARASGQAVKRGDTVGLAWSNEHEHRFDLATGRRLEPRQTQVSHFVSN